MAEPHKRRRRTPEEARQEILDAAEHIILTHGPVELKFQTIADQAGLAKSNVHHHFGGVLEIKRALTERLLNRLTHSLVLALAEEATKDLEDYAEKVLLKIYKILAGPENARLIGWVALSTEIDAHEDFVKPLPAIISVVVDKLKQFIPEKEAELLVRAVVYQIAVTAVGEGIIGDALHSVMSGRGPDPDGVEWIRKYWRILLSDAIEAHPLPDAGS